MLDLYPSFSSLSIRLNHIQNLEAVDARERYPKEYTTWREDPANFNVNGIYPIRKLWETAREAWREILFSPVSFSLNIYFHIVKLFSFHMNIFLIDQGESFLVVTHKSILRALICTALGLPPERYVMGFNRCSHPGGYFCWCQKKKKKKSWLLTKFLDHFVIWI